MPAWLIVILSILAVVLVAFIVLLILGGRLQKKANSQQEALASAAQTVSMLIIDKKKLKITEANLPKVVTDQVPKYARRAKFPIVKARVVGGGSKPMNLIADAAVSSQITFVSLIWHSVMVPSLIPTSPPKYVALLVIVFLMTPSSVLTPSIKQPFIMPLFTPAITPKPVSSAFALSTLLFTFPTIPSSRISP